MNSNFGQNNFIVRKALPRDAEAIAKVHVDVWRSAYRGILPESFLANLKYETRANQHRARLSQLGQRECFFVAQLEDRIIGFACAGPSCDEVKNYEGELYAIYLYEEFHGRGMGQQLFLKVKTWMIEAKYRGMFLWVLKNNPSRKFYEAMGGKLLDSRTIEIGAPVEEVRFIWPDIRGEN